LSTSFNRKNNTKHRFSTLKMIRKSISKSGDLIISAGYLFWKKITRLPPPFTYIHTRTYTHVLNSLQITLLTKSTVARTIVYPILRYLTTRVFGHFLSSFRPQFFVIFYELRRTSNTLYNILVIFDYNVNNTFLKSPFQNRHHSFARTFLLFYKLKYVRTVSLHFITGENRRHLRVVSKK